MRTMEVIIEADDLTGVNKTAQDHTEDLNRGEGDNKTSIGTSTKATMDNLTPLTEATQ